VRVETVGNATLYLGDSQRMGLNVSCSAVISDPPYGASYVNGPISPSSISTTRKRIQRAIVGDKQPFDPTPWLSAPEVIFTGAQYFYDRLPAGGTFHVWNKRGQYKPLDQSDADIIWSKKGGAVRCMNLVWRGICRHVEHAEEIVHPAQKPIALMEWLVGMTTLPVIDPFMGSGSTGVACARLGRAFIGAEIEADFFEIALERITAEISKGRLFA
jgi:site-specific DNA-methyltransferase (adenine-specific)